MPHVLFYSISDGSVCFAWKCLHEERQKYCFRDGKIPGAVIYFLEDSVIKIFLVDGRYYHGFHRLGVKNKE